LLFISDKQIRNAKKSSDMITRIYAKTSFLIRTTNKKSEREEKEGDLPGQHRHKLFKIV